MVDTPDVSTVQDFVASNALEQGVDPHLSRAVANHESGFNPLAVGPVTRSGERAMGVMQLMPGTAKEMGATDPFDYQQNVVAGNKYLKTLQDKFGDDTESIVRAYNAGPGNMANADQAYVTKVLADREAFANAAVPPPPPGFTMVPPEQAAPEQVPPPPPGFTMLPGSEEGFNTQLSPAQEAKFQQWKAKYAPKDSGEDYDLRGAFAAGVKPDAERGHFPDTFKKPNHPTFSEESQYSGVNGNVGGKWIKRDGKQFFVPSDTNRQHFTTDQMREYFQEQEPDAELVEGQGPQQGGPIPPYVPKKPVDVSNIPGTEAFGGKPPGVPQPNANEIFNRPIQGVARETVEPLTTWQGIKSTLFTPSIKAAGGSTVGEEYDRAVDWAKHYTAEALGEPNSETARKLPEVVAVAEFAAKYGRLVPDVIDFLTSAGGAATAGTEALVAPAVRAAIGAAYSTDIGYKAVDAIDKAKQDPTAENIAEAAKLATMAAIPFIRPAMTAREAAGKALEAHNVEAARLVEQERRTAPPLVSEEEYATEKTRLEGQKAEVAKKVQEYLALPEVERKVLERGDLETQTPPVDRLKELAAHDKRLDEQLAELDRQRKPGVPEPPAEFGTPAQRATSNPSPLQRYGRGKARVIDPNTGDIAFDGTLPEARKYILDNGLMTEEQLAGLEKVGEVPTDVTKVTIGGKAARIEYLTKGQARVIEEESGKVLRAGKAGDVQTWIQDQKAQSATHAGEPEFTKEHALGETKDDLQELLKNIRDMEGRLASGEDIPMSGATNRTTSLAQRRQMVQDSIDANRKEYETELGKIKDQFGEEAANKLRDEVENGSKATPEDYDEAYSHLVEKRGELQSKRDALQKRRNAMLPGKAAELQPEADSLDAELKDVAGQISHVQKQRAALGAPGTTPKGGPPKPITPVELYPSTPPSEKPVTRPAESAPRLPENLGGAQLRYDRGSDSYSLTFESDIDRAAYEAAREGPSAPDSEYMDFARKHTGLSADDVRAHGAAVAQAIKNLAGKATPGTLHIPAQTLPSQPSEEKKPAGSADLEPGATFETPDGKYKVNKVLNNNVFYDFEDTDGNRRVMRKPVEQFRTAVGLPAQGSATKPEGGSVAERTVASFATSQGSEYQVNGESTTRTKSLHPGHEATDVGQKPPSARTVYISPDLAREIGMWNTLSSTRKRIILGDDGKITLISAAGPDNKQGQDATIADNSFTTVPAVGRAPLELFDEGAKGRYSGNHPGNAITVIRHAPKVSEVSASLPKSPQVSATGEEPSKSGEKPEGKPSQELSGNFRNFQENPEGAENTGGENPIKSQEDLVGKEPERNAWADMHPNLARGSMSVIDLGRKRQAASQEAFGKPFHELTQAQQTAVDHDLEQEAATAFVKGQTKPTTQVEKPSTQVEAEPKLGIGEGIRVTWTAANGQKLTGKVTSVDEAEGTASINTDQVAHIGGRIRIGRIETVKLDRLTVTSGGTGSESETGDRTPSKPKGEASAEPKKYTATSVAAARLHAIKLRDHKRQAYAKAYLRELVEGVKVPDDVGTDLAPMARQSVRMDLEAILKPEAGKVLDFARGKEQLAIKNARRIYQNLQKSDMNQESVDTIGEWLDEIEDIVKRGPEGYKDYADEKGNAEHYYLGALDDSAEHLQKAIARALRVHGGELTPEKAASEEFQELVEEQARAREQAKQPEKKAEPKPAAAPLSREEVLAAAKAKQKELADAARKRLLERKGEGPIRGSVETPGERPAQPLDPEELEDLANMGAEWVLDGQIAYGRWSVRAAKELGEMGLLKQYSPHLRAIHERAQEIAGERMEEFATPEEEEKPAAPTKTEEERSPEPEEKPVAGPKSFDPLEAVPPSSIDEAKSNLKFWLREIDASIARVNSGNGTTHDARVIHQGPLIAVRLGNWIELQDDARWIREQPAVRKVSTEALHHSITGAKYDDADTRKEAAHYEPYLKDLRALLEPATPAAKAPIKVGDRVLINLHDGKGDARGTVVGVNAPVAGEGNTGYKVDFDDGRQWAVHAKDVTRSIDQTPPPLAEAKLAVGDYIQWTDKDGQVQTGRIRDVGEKDVNVAVTGTDPDAVPRLEYVKKSDAIKIASLPPAGTSAKAGLPALAEAVYRKLKAGESLGNVTEYNKLVEKYLGGSRASGDWTPKDAFDAMEAGVNKLLLERGADLMKMDPIKALAELRELMSRLTTQGARTQEQIDNQQFSTPPTESFVAAKVANIKPDDVMLEPSAGNGGIAVWPKSIGATVVVNEISDRRAKFLEELGFGKPTAHDGELIASLLAPAPRPTVVVMNPPFSASTLKSHEAANSNKYGFNHVDSALQALLPNGRLVVILGGGQANEPNGGASLTAGGAGRWFSRIAQKYNVRANIRIHGKEYAKYGTNFATRIIVIDKDGPTPSQTQPGIQNWDSVVQGNVDTLEEAYNLLKDVAKTRPEAKAEAGASSQPGAGQNQSGPGVAPNPSGSHGGHPGQQQGGQRGSGEGEPANRPGDTGGQHGGVDTGNGNQPSGGIQPESQPPGNPTTAPASGPEGSTPHADDERPPALTLERDTPESLAENENTEEHDLSPYVKYKPTLKGPKHPGDIVETRTMATAPLPPITYGPHLPSAVSENGVLSAVQMEAIALAGQQNKVVLPSGAYSAVLIGDGTGVGKGRESAGILWDNYRQGRKRLVWVSEKWDLMDAAINDFRNIGAEPFMRGITRQGDKNVLGPDAAVRPLGAFKYGVKIKHDGLIFTTYASIRGESKKTGLQRVHQLEEYLRGDDDGEGAYLLFDEAHNLKNAVASAGGEESETGRKVKELLERMPKLRTASLSATAATDVVNLGYLDRLGLWGAGTAFPAGFGEFQTQVAPGGLAAMELIARELKLQGKYLSRTLSYDGVTYAQEKHELNPDQKKIYRTAVHAWQAIVQAAEDTIANTTGGGGRQTGNFMSAFGGAQQNFFSLLITALKIPTAVALANKALAENKSVVISLVNTNEAAQNREKAKLADADPDDEPPDFDFGPKELLVNLIEQNYPTQQWQDDVDSAGRPIKSPVWTVDENGVRKPVQNPQAVEEKKALLAMVNRDLKLPDNPLDILINAFGGDRKVAEITGRTQKLDRETGLFVNRGDKNVAQDQVNLHEMRAFQNGDKRVAILSKAGGTGISLHAGNDVPNKQKRYHMTLQVGWQADKAMQMLGRTHRTNQAHPPEYVFLISDLAGEQRFVSTILKRLASLGALSKGQKNATASSAMGDSVSLETEQGRAATNAFYVSLLRDILIPGSTLTGMQVLTDLRVLKESDNGLDVPQRDRQNVKKLLNRLLAIDPDHQRVVFNYFFNIFNAAVANAIEQGRLDTGVKTLPGDEFEVKEQRVLSTDPKTGAQTVYYPVDAKVATKRVSPKELDELIEKHQERNPRIMIRVPQEKPASRYNTYREPGAEEPEESKEPKVALIYDAPDTVHEDGRVEPAVYAYSPENGKRRKVPATAPARDGYQEIEARAKAELDRIKNKVDTEQRILDSNQRELDRYTKEGRDKAVRDAERDVASANSQLENYDLSFGPQGWRKDQEPVAADRKRLDDEITRREAALEEARNFKLPETAWQVRSVENAKKSLEEAKKPLAEAEKIAADPEKHAMDLWKKAYDAAPTHITQEHHLIGGAVMRFWNPIRDATFIRNSIYTTNDTKSGQRVVGIDIPAARISALLDRISGGRSTVNVLQLHDDVLRNGTRYTLENNIQVLRGRVAREQVIQMIPPNKEVGDRLLELGLRYESGVVSIYYVPSKYSGPEPQRTGAILGRVLKEYPVQSEPEAAHEDEGPIRGSREPRTAAGPVFYSQLERAIADKMPARAMPAQVEAIVKNPQNGVKQDEIDWTGFADWLKEQKGSIGKDAALDFLRSNGVQIQEVTKGAAQGAKTKDAWAQEEYSLPYAQLDAAQQAWVNHMAAPAQEPLNWTSAPGVTGAKFAAHVLPGGENYREILLTIPPNQNADHAARSARVKELIARKDRLTKELAAIPTPDTTVIDKRIREISHWPTSPANAKNPKDQAELDELGAQWGKLEAQRHRIADLVRQAENAETQIDMVMRDRTPSGYRGRHWNEPNVIAHVRMNDRTGPNGERILHMEENQSDWHQTGKRKGYQAKPLTRDERWKLITLLSGDDVNLLGYESSSQALEAIRANPDWIKRWDVPANPELRSLGERYRNSTNDEAVPAGPFSKTWHELVFKRMLRYAAENGYDALTWTTGAQQNERYDLSKQVKHIAWEKNDDGTYNIDAPLPDGSKGVYEEDISPSKLEEMVGKDVAKRIDAGEGRPDKEAPLRDWKILEGPQLEVGGLGMKGFYDKILPDFARKYGKKWGATVGTTTLETDVKGGWAPSLEQRVSGLNDEELNKAADYLGFAYDPDWDPEWDTEERGPQETEEEMRHELLNRIRNHIHDGGTLEQMGISSKAARQQETVHSINITPAMRESVMQGQPLFQRDSGKRPVAERFAVTDRPVGEYRHGVVWTNARTIEALTTLMDTDAAAGLYVPPMLARQLLGKLQTVATPEANAKWKPLVDAVAKAIKDSIRHNGSIIIVSNERGRGLANLKATVRHERFHQAMGNLMGAARGQIFLRHPLAQLAADNLADRYDRADEATMWAEIGAHLAAGPLQWNSMGLGREQAKELFKEYLKLLDERTIAKIEHLHPLLNEVLHGEHAISEVRQADNREAQKAEEGSGRGDVQRGVRQDVSAEPDFVRLDREAVAEEARQANPTLTRLYRVDGVPGAGLPDWLQESDEAKKIKGATGRWFTADPEHLEFYLRDAGPGAKINIVDVPTSELEQFRVTNQPPEVSRYSARPHEEFFLPRSIADRREVVRAEDLPETIRKMYSPAGSIATKLRTLASDTTASVSLGGLTRFLQNRFGDDAPEANYSGLGAYKSKYVRNLSQTEMASLPAHTAGIRAAASRAQAGAILRSSVPSITKALEGSGVDWPEMRLTLIESRLHGLRERWNRFAEEARDLDDKELEKAFDDHFADLLGAMEGKRGMPENVVQTATELAESKDWDTLRDYLQVEFERAAAHVAEVMDPDRFDVVRHNPGFQNALEVYKQLVEGPMAENHALNEGVFSESLGPLATYYPLIPTERPSSPGPGRRLPYHKPKNLANNFATGLAEGYEIAMDALRDRLAQGIRSNDKAALIRTLEAEGLLIPAARGHKTITIDGREYEAERVEISQARQIIQNGKSIFIPARMGLMPKWLARELRPILEKLHFDAPTAVDKIMNAVNTFALAGPADFVFHSSNVLGALVANTPFLANTLVGKAASVPFIKRFAAMFYVIATDPTTAEAAAEIIEMAKVGALPDRYASVTYSKRIAEEIGAEHVKFVEGKFPFLNFAPTLYGPHGLDVRARLLMWRLAKSLNPGATPQELYHFVNQLGNYVPDLQGEVERALKASGWSPFYTAGSTMIRNGINAWTGAGPMPKKGLALRIYQQLTGGAIMTLAIWAALYFYLTGKWPWNDKRAKLLKVPVGGGSGRIDPFRHSKYGNLLWGTGPEVGYIDFNFFNPMIGRGARALGISGAFETQRLGGSGPQMFEAALRDVLNSFAHPMLGPIARATFTGVSGREAYLTGLRDESGSKAPQFFPAYNKKQKPGFLGGLLPGAFPNTQPRNKPGFAAESGAQLGASLRELNAFYGNLGEATGFLGEDQGQKGNGYLRMITNLALPGLVANATKPFARAETVRKQRYAMGQ